MTAWLLDGEELGRTVGKRLAVGSTWLVAGGWRAVGGGHMWASECLRLSLSVYPGLINCVCGGPCRTDVMHTLV